MATAFLQVQNPNKGGDPKKEDFRKYLERNGVIDTLTKVLVGLYEEPEKPDSPIDYIKQFLGGPSEIDTEALKQENEELRAQVEELKAKVEQFSKVIFVNKAAGTEVAPDQTNAA